MGYSRVLLNTRLFTLVAFIHGHTPNRKLVQALNSGKKGEGQSTRKYGETLRSTSRLFCGVGHETKR